MAEINLLIATTPEVEYWLIRYAPNDEWDGCGFSQPNNDELQEFQARMRRLQRDHYTPYVARLIRLDK